MNPHFHLQTALNALNMMPSFTTQPNFRPIPINSPFLHPYFPMLPELMASRFQPQAQMQTTNNYTMDPLNDVKTEFSLKLEGQCGYIPQTTKIEPSDKDLSLNGSDITTPSCVDQLSIQINLKSEIEKIVRFLLSNMGKDNEASILKTRDYYLHNPCLLEVYDKISMKYYSAKKCKEDLIRYILRKVFRYLRVSIMKKENVSSKKASLLMCKRYFNPGTQLPESEIEDEDKFLESLMPYNKNSKNKTMNISFILEIFSSPNFCKEYQDFLPKLYTILAEDNKKKEAKLVKFILDCVEKKSMEKINGLQRLPWLDVWTEDAKNLAIAIMPNKRLIYNSHKPKH